MHRLSLRTWILLPAWVLVTVLVVILSASQADTLVRAWLKSSHDLAELAGQQVKLTLLRRLEESAASSSAAARDRGDALEAAKNRWAAFIQSDPTIASALESIAGRGGAIVEVSIADQSGLVLASSDPARTGKSAARAESLASLEGLNAVARFRRVFSLARDFGYTIPIGVEGQSQALFTIHVLVSNVLLRESLGPGMRRILLVAGAALLLSLALVYAVAAITTANLKRIGMLIDRIAGEKGPRRAATANPEKVTVPAEFAAVGSKLSLLDNRVRDALHDAEEYRRRVNAMLDGLEEAILLFDEDRLVLAAGPVRSLLGSRPEGISGLRRRDVLPPATVLGQFVDAAFLARRRIRGQAISSVENGRERGVIVNLDFIENESNPERTTALLRLRDAEGAGEVESQLKLSSRLEAINRLTGGVAHEIKNPLNAISARLALLESIVDETPNAERQIRAIGGEIERLDRVVRTFLDFTRPLELSRERIDLVALGREVIKGLEPDAARRGIELQFEAADSLSLRVRGDKDLLTQAIINIACNALEAMTEGGELRVRATEHAGSARLSIMDTGPGIPESQRTEIFKLYFTTKKNGSGIGLAVAYRTLQLHGGELGVESEVGRGSTFHLTIPMLHMEEVVETDAPHHITAGAGSPV